MELKIRVWDKELETFIPEEQIVLIPKGNNGEFQIIGNPNRYEMEIDIKADGTEWYHFTDNPLRTYGHKDQDN